MTARTPSSSAEGCATRFCSKPRARMLALSSASSAAEGGTLRTLVGDRTSLLRGIFRTAGVVVMAGVLRDGRTRASLLSCETRHKAPFVLSLYGRHAGTSARRGADERTPATGTCQRRSRRHPTVTPPLVHPRPPARSPHRGKRE